jgi:DNA-3-methyladenine glycosylase II
MTSFARMRSTRKKP